MTDDNSTDLPHLLVVDDSRLMRRAIIKILGKDTYRITEAGDGEEGWKALQADDSIQVVFSDLSMPELDGFGLLERIRTSDEERIKNVAVIIITGAEDDEQTKEKALSSGASDFISKPFDSVQLKTRTKTHVDAAKTSQALNQKTEELEKSAAIDLLTGLANKNHFIEQGAKDLAYAKRHRGELVIMRVDIDNFNKLFTTHGKDPANFILQKVGEIFLDALRREDTVARIGVAKLAIIMPQANRIGARQVADRIRGQIEDKKFEYGGIILPVTISTGIAAIDINNQTTLDTFLDIADRHLALAVANGGNCVVVEEQAATAATGAAEAPPPEQIPDIEQALLRIEHDSADSLSPYLRGMLRRVLPLIQLCNSKLELGIDDALAKIRQYLEK